MAGNVSFDCPHCKKNVYRSPNGWHPDIGNPIRICPHCNQDYIFPFIYEWSIAGPFYQFWYTFIENHRAAFLLLACLSLFDKNKIPVLIFLLLWIITCICRLKLSDYDKIKESYLRTKDNPQYLQKLSDMGYLYIDFRIDPYYK